MWFEFLLIYSSLNLSKKSRMGSSGPKGAAPWLDVRMILTAMMFTTEGLAFLINAANDPGYPCGPIFATDRIGPNPNTNPMIRNTIHPRIKKCRSVFWVPPCIAPPFPIALICLFSMASWQIVMKPYADNFYPTVGSGLKKGCRLVFSFISNSSAKQFRDDLFKRVASERKWLQFSEGHGQKISAPDAALAGSHWFMLRLRHGLVQSPILLGLIKK